MQSQISIFLTTKYFSLNIVNCPYWDSNPGLIPSLCPVFFSNILSALPHELRMMYSQISIYYHGNLLLSNRNLINRN